jgi:hypothetical protein
LNWPLTDKLAQCCQQAAGVVGAASLEEGSGGQLQGDVPGAGAVSSLLMTGAGGGGGAGEGQGEIRVSDSGTSL